MTLYWLLQQSADVPEDDDWLSAFERTVLAKLWAPKRRRDWRLGRWTAKCALVRAGALGTGTLEPAEWGRISIRANEAGAPCCFVDDGDGDWQLSISHSGEFGLAAVARKPAAIGCDIETIGRRGEEFVIDWFTESERVLASRADGEAKSRMVTVIWSAKESALKALGVGLRLDTRQVDVRLDGDVEPIEGWRLFAAATPEQVLTGWWKTDRGCAMTLISEPPVQAPTAL